MKPKCQLDTPPLSSGKAAKSVSLKKRSNSEPASSQISKNRKNGSQIRKGRLPSIILQSTTPISGIWIPPRHYGPIQRNRRWVIGKSGKIIWEPEQPEGSENKEEAIFRIAEEVRLKKKSGLSGILRFSGTSKTGITWSLPPVASCPTIDESCGACYALDGFYRTNVAAQVNRVLRLEYLKSLIESDRLSEWVDWMVNSLRRLRPVEPIPHKNLDEFLLKHLETQGVHRKAVVFFRWHDSGDIFHADYGRAIFEVARRTPSVMHWIPTRMGSLVAKLAAGGCLLPANIAVQVSCRHGGSLEAIQLAAVERIRTIQPDARVGITYAMAGPQSRFLPLKTVRSLLGGHASICPATVASRTEDRTCQGCRRCWGTAEPQSILVYATHHGD